MKMNKSSLLIAIIMQSPDIGGAETYMYSLVEQFLKKGNHIYFATNSQRFANLFKKHNVPVDTIPYLIDIIGNWKGMVKAVAYLPLSILFYTKLLKEYQKKKVDVILMSGFGEKMLVTFLSLFIKIPVVWIEYGRLKTVFKNNFYLPKIIYRLLKGVPKRIIVPSQNTKESLITDARVSLAKLSVIPCGTVAVSPGKSKIVNQFKGKFVVGNVSRMTREKGQQLIISAAPEIIKKVPNAFFILVGNGPDKNYFQNLIEKQKLEKYFLLPGFVEDKYDYLYAMDVFVFPTIWELEGFGVVTIEAMMSGVSVVASNIGPVPEIIKDGITGLLFEPKSTQGLVDAIVKLAIDERLRNALSKNAKKVAKEKYNIDVISDKVISVLYDATF